MARITMITSRQWNSPVIETFVDNTEVGAKMSIDDFVESLVEEIGNPTTMLTKAQLKQRISDAVVAITKEMKTVTSHVV